MKKKWPRGWSNKKEEELQAKLLVLFPKRSQPTLSEGNPASKNWDELTQQFPHDKEGNSITFLGIINLKPLR